MIFEVNKAADGAGYRPYTSKGAVAEVMASIPNGEFVDIERIIGMDGADVPLSRIQAYVSVIDEWSEYMTRKLPREIGLVRIYRR